MCATCRENEKVLHKSVLHKHKYERAPFIKENSFVNELSTAAKGGKRFTFTASGGWGLSLYSRIGQARLARSHFAVYKGSVVLLLPVAASVSEQLPRVAPLKAIASIF